MKTLTLKLKAWQNHDRGYQVLPKPFEVTVTTLKEASEAAREWIVANELGGGNVGDLRVYEGKKLIALISYNGRVWTTEKEWNLRKEII